MKKIFLIALLCGLTAWLTACALTNWEYPIESAQKAAISFGNKAEFNVITRNGDSNTILVFINGIDVRLRDDGKNYTSITVSKFSFSDVFYDRGTILVPNEADIQKWNKWLEKFGKLKKKPKRVSPPNLN